MYHAVLGLRLRGVFRRRVVRWWEVRNLFPAVEPDESMFTANCSTEIFQRFGPQVFADPDDPIVMLGNRHIAISGSGKMEAWGSGRVGASWHLKGRESDGH